MGLRFSLYALLPLQQEPRAPHDVKFLLRPFHDKSPSPRKRPLYLSPPARERLLPLRRPSRRLRACAGQRRGRSPRNFPSGAPAGRTETGERCGGGGEGGGGAHSPRPQGGGGARLSPAPPPSPRQRADCAAPLLSGFPGAALRAPARLGDVTGRAVSGGPCRKREEEGASCAAGSAEEGRRRRGGGRPWRRGITTGPTAAAAAPRCPTPPSCGTSSRGEAARHPPPDPGGPSSPS